MNYTIYDYLGLFFLYAFLGWLLETAVAAVRKKHMVNRGFLNGPLCAIYGITAVAMTRYLYELQSSPVFLFLLRRNHICKPVSHTQNLRFYSFFIE